MINSFMELTGKQAIRYEPDLVFAYMTGAYVALQNKEGDIRLIYKDGSEHRVNCPELDLATEPSWFLLVETVRRMVKEEKEISNGNNEGNDEGRTEVQDRDSSTS